jgi:hypothetical protein
MLAENAVIALMTRNRDLFSRFEAQTGIITDCITVRGFLLGGFFFENIDR